MSKGVLIIVFGIASILAGIFGKNFSKADVITGAAYKQRSSTWSGRLVFITVGIFLVGVGIKLLLGS